MKKVLVLVVIVVSLVSSAFADNSHYYDYKVKDKYLKNICFEGGSLDYSWRNALKNALDKYNNVFLWKAHFKAKFNQSIKCSYTVNVKTINDVRNKKNSGTAYLAVTEGRHNWYKKPFDYIYINTANTYKLAYSTEKTALLMHEISHVIGFKHKGAGRGKKIPGTSNDPDAKNSIMVGGGSDYIYGEEEERSPTFTTYDIKSFNYLY